jgi:hypothetical protein
VLLLVVAAAVLVAARFHVPLCPLAAFFGVPCPGCGLARAMLSLLRGDVTGALALHPLVFVAAPAAVALALHVTSPVAPTPRRERLLVACSTVLLVLMLVVWIARFTGAFGGPVAIG